MKITVTLQNEHALVKSPYSADYVARIKRIGGAKWNASEKGWLVPKDALDIAREILREVYGEDDQSGAVEKVDVKLTVSQELSELHRDVTLLGRCLSHASGRDSGAIIGDGVSYLAGNATSGGSVKNWRSVVVADSIIVLTNVPCSLINDAVLPDGVTAEIIKKHDADKNALTKEKEQLLARLADIDKLLSK